MWWFNLIVELVTVSICEISVNTSNTIHEYSVNFGTFSKTLHEIVHFYWN